MPMLADSCHFCSRKLVQRGEVKLCSSCDHGLWLGLAICGDVSQRGNDDADFLDTFEPTGDAP